MLLSFPRCGDVRALFAALVAFLSMGVGGRAAEDLDRLYRATTVITGNMEHEKQRGFAECLDQVLVKLSGDTDLSGSPAVVALGVRVADFIDSHTLVDRMAGIPVHDEQGTRERPHILTVEFSRAKIDAALQELGREPWLERPVITLAVGVDNGARHFFLTSQAELGTEHRQALTGIGERLGLTLSFPDEWSVASSALDLEALGTAGHENLDALRRAADAEVLLAGRLLWSDRAFRWSSRWQLVTDNALEQWQADGISFDTVFRRTLEKTAWTLSSANRE